MITVRKAIKISFRKHNLICTILHGVIFQKIVKKMAQNHERRLHNHPNTEAIQLLNYREATRRLNRTKTLELC
jgi:hypothetical protein